MDDLHIKRQHHLTARISVFIVRTQFKYSMLTEIKDLETLELFDSIVFDANYLKAGGKVKSIIGMPYKPYSYLMEQYVICFRKLTIFSVGNKTVMDKLSVGVMTQLDKMYNQCYKTPVALVNGILDKLPVDIWNNPNKTFIDLFCGTGEFITQVQKRLMAGLVEIPLEERLDFINKNMLYYNDINNNWVEWTRFRLGGGNGFNEDFSKWEPDMKFDVIIGNPPYQGDTNSDGNKNKQPIWPKFLKKCLSATVDNGYLAFVTPRTWASGSRNETKEIFKTKEVTYLDMNVTSHFNIVGDICSYIIKNSNSTNKTIDVVGVDHQLIPIKLNEYDYIPFNITTLGLSIFDKVRKINSKYYSFSESKKQISEYSGPRIVFMAGRNGLYLKRLFVESENVIEKGVGQFARLPVNISNEQIGNLTKILYHPIYPFLFDLLGGNRGLNRTWILNALPQLDYNHSWSDEEIYQHFGLTEEEILYIEQTVK